jgi:uncharacterized protein (DUF697 family)
MTRKPLPKAIRQSLSEMRAFATGVVTDRAAHEPQSVARRDAFEAEPTEFSQPAANDQSLPAALVHADRYAAKRRALARQIVDRHRTYAAVGGLLPVPVANIAGVTAIIMRMVKQLSGLYGVPFQHDRTRSAIISLIGGTVPTGFGAATASTLAVVMPAGALLGLAVSAVTAGALTRAIGLVFVEHFESEAI